MSKVTLLVGRIGSGKTYTASLLKEEYDAVVLSSDEMMLSLFDVCLGARHREFERKCYGYLCLVAESIIKTKRDVILDFGCWFESEIADIKSFFDSKNIQLETVYIYADDDVRKERIKKRNELLLKSQKREYIIDDEKLSRFDKKFEEPKSYDRIIKN